MQKQSYIEIKAYDDNWPNIFKAEACKLQAALGDNCTAIYHIGSTSVPGLAAKPIIDIVPVVCDILALNTATSAMEDLGYEAKGEYGMLFRRYFQKKGFNIHIFEQNSAEIDGHLLFRDWMRNHPEDRKAYAALKQDLALRFPNDISQYVIGKDAFITHIHSKTGFSGLHVVKALTPREWDALKYYRTEYFMDFSGLEDSYSWTFNHSEHVHLILYQGTQIIGYAHIQSWKDSLSMIKMLVIDKSVNNQNTRDQFLAFIEKWLKTLSVKSIYIESRTASLDFYIKNGYTELPSNFTGIPPFHDEIEAHPKNILLSKEL